MTIPEFVSFPKIARWSRPVVVTEKLNGTNALVWISDDLSEIAAGSRTRWITPQSDNFGFAGWVERNKEELLKLGPGSHFGEFIGKGIQRGYGLQDKQFWLFNTHRWSDPATRPACCNVVPVLWTGNMDIVPIAALMARLEREGSVAVPGWQKPEGIVIYHTASGTLFKKLLEGDELPKGMANK